MKKRNDTIAQNMVFLEWLYSKGPIKVAIIKFSSSNC
jgi:hypothetical protein